jgi:hypothetical protein
MRAFQTLLAAAAALTLGAAAQAQVERVGVDQSAFSLGTLTPATGALSRDLWADTRPEAVGDLLTAVPVTYDDPLHLELLRRVTLSPGEGPRGASNELAGRKFLTAARAGFYREAASLAEIVPALSTEPALAHVVALANLLDGETDTACARGAGLRDGRTDAFWVKLRFICYVRAGENSAAELTLGLLDRQDALSEAETRRFERFLADQTPELGDQPIGTFDYVILREGGVPLDQAALDRASAAVVAAVARDASQTEAVREAALIRSLNLRTIEPQEGMRLIDAVTSTELASDVITVAATQRGSLEQSEAIGAALRAAGDDWDGFVARARLMSGLLPEATPVENFAPNAAEIALAGMVNDQTQVAERWLLALANDASQENSTARVAALLDIFATIDPGTARRLGSYLGMALDPPAVELALDAEHTGAIPLSTFVGAALPVAEAGSEGPAALLYLMGLDVAAGEENRMVREAVMNWAKDRADLEWLARRAAFRAAAQAYLAGGDGAARTDDGELMPRIKPARN